MHTPNQFIYYVAHFYGKNGPYPLVKDGKHLTRAVIKEHIPFMHQRMKEQDWPYSNGDSMDREFMREEVLEPLGYIETN